MLPSLSWGPKKPHRHFTVGGGFFQHRLDLITLMLPQPLWPLVLFLGERKKGPGVVDLGGSLVIPSLSVTT